MKTTLKTMESDEIKQEQKNLDNVLNLGMLKAGMILANKYEIKRELARGGMGIVYEAYHQYMHRKVAIKMIMGNKIDVLQLKSNDLKKKWMHTLTYCIQM